MTQASGSQPPAAADAPPDANAAAAPSAAANPAVERVIERFGGIRPMAAKLDAPVTTVQGWKKRGAIPPARHDDLRAAAARHGVELDEAELTAAGQHDDSRAEEPAIEEAAAVIDLSAEAPADAKTDEKADSPKAEETKTEEIKTEEIKAEAPKVEEPKIEEPAVEIIRPAAVEADSRADRPRPAAAASAKESAGKGNGMAATLSIAALAVAVAAVTQPLWWGRVAGSSPAAPAAVAVAGDPALKAELAALAQKLDKLEKAPAPAAATAPAQPDPRVADLVAQLGALKGDVARVGDALATLAARPAADAGAASALLAVEGKLKDLQSQIADIRKAEAEAAAAPSPVSPAVAAALAQLRAAVAEGKPFAAELKAARDASGADAELAKALDALAPLAASGAPTVAALTARFQPLPSEIVRADNRGEAGDWIGHVQGVAMTLVTVRPRGAAEGDGAAALAARAEAALAAGKLSVAVDELAKLQGPAAKPVQPWLAGAKARLAADAAAEAALNRAVALSKGEGSAAESKGAAQ